MSWLRRKDTFIRCLRFLNSSYAMGVYPSSVIIGNASQVERIFNIGNCFIPTPAKSAFYCVTHNQNCTYEKTGRGGYSIAAVSRLFYFFLTKIVLIIRPFPICPCFNRDIDKPQKERTKKWQESSFIHTMYRLSILSTKQWSATKALKVRPNCPTRYKISKKFFVGSILISVMGIHSTISRWNETSPISSHENAFVYFRWPVFV